MDIKPGGTAGVTITLVPAIVIVWDKGIFYLWKKESVIKNPMSREFSMKGDQNNERSERQKYPL